MHFLLGISLYMYQLCCVCPVTLTEELPFSKSLNKAKPSHGRKHWDIYVMHSYINVIVITLGGHER